MLDPGQPKPLVEVTGAGGAVALPGPPFSEEGAEAGPLIHAPPCSCKGLVFLPSGAVRLWGVFDVVGIDSQIGF